MNYRHSTRVRSPFPELMGRMLPARSSLTWVHSRRGFRPWTTRSRSTPGTGSSWAISSRSHAATGMSRKPTRGLRRSTESSSRVRFLGSESDKAHGRWFRVFAEHYDTLAAAIEPRRTPNAAAALHRLFRRPGPVPRVLDVGCGTFSIDLGLVARGYSVVGRDRAARMIRASRPNLREAGLPPEVP